jgi:hypothetical protein
MSNLDYFKSLILKNKFSYVSILKKNSLFDSFMNSFPYLKDIYGDNISNKQVAWHLINSPEIQMCDVCKKKPKLFIYMKGKYAETCSEACRRKLVSSRIDFNELSKKVKQTIAAKYGSENFFKTKEFKEKNKATCLKKYGTEYYLQTDEFKEKSKATCLKKYGVDIVSKSEKIKEKVKENNLLKYKKEHFFQTEEFKEKSKATCLKKYGTEKILESSNHKNILFKNNKPDYEKMLKAFNFSLIRYGKTCEISCQCGKTFNINRNTLNNRIYKGINICRNFCDKDIKISSGHKKLLEQIQEFYKGNILINHKIFNQELDIFLPDLNIGIEYNGLYWHGELKKEQNYHKNKFLFFENIGIRLISVWSDDFINKNDLVINVIKNAITGGEKIFARNCHVKLVEKEKEFKFLEENHLQGYNGSTVCYGLYHNEELVQLMSFTYWKSKKSWEIQRLCTKMDINVIGGTEKLWKHFLSNNNPKHVFSYSSCDYFTGKVYEKLGMNLEKITEPSYWWSDGYERITRQSVQKHKLIKMFPEMSNMSEIEIMKSLKYFRVFNCGNKKYSITF